MAVREAVLPVHARQVQAAAADVPALLDSLFQNANDEVYGRIWSGCGVFSNLERDVQAVATLPTEAARVRAVYEIVIGRAQQTGIALPALDILNPARLADLAEAEVLYKFFEAVAASTGARFMTDFLQTLQGNLIERAQAIGQWMQRNESQFAEIEELQLINMNLTALPAQIGHFTGLKWLSLKDNHLTTLPRQIGNCVSLQRLNARNNQLTEIPFELERCTHLRELDLQSNQLVTIHASLGACMVLEELNLNNNRLNYLPMQVLQIPTLRILGLSLNRFRAIPDGIEQCAALESLEISWNRLTAIRAEIAQCPALHTIEASDNLITTVPAELGQCAALGYLDLAHNPLTQTRAAILGILRPAFFAYRLILDDNPPPMPQVLPAAAFAPDDNPPVARGCWANIWHGIREVVWSFCTEVGVRLTHWWNWLVG